MFASNRLTPAGEGWYVDQVKVETMQNGAPICHVVDWPGRVPVGVSFELDGLGGIEASWADACNLGTLPGQTYSIQAGDIDQLSATGNYNHAPMAGQCGLCSPATFTPGPGNEYYLVVPNEGGHDGGGGTDSAGNSRPSAVSVCGLPREAACP